MTDGQFRPPRRICQRCAQCVPAVQSPFSPQLNTGHSWVQRLDHGGARIWF